MAWHGEGLIFGPFMVIAAMAMLFAVIPLVLGVLVLVDIARTPDPAFGPPWDNGKAAWLLGAALGFVVPMGTIVVAVLWWVQGRPGRRAGLVPRPFWAPGQYPMRGPGHPGPPPPGAWTGSGGPGTPDAPGGPTASGGPPS